MDYRKVWEKTYGQIPIDNAGRSYEIHHIDGNRNNNSLENLKCISIEEHYTVHKEQGDFRAACIIAERLKLSAEELEAIHSIRRGQPLSDKTRHKMSEAKKGKKRPPHTEERKQYQSTVMKGKKHSEEAKRKMSEKKKGKPATEAWLKSRIGRKHSEETKEKMREARIKLLQKKS
jgi:hypothetical protein